MFILVHYIPAAGHFFQIFQIWSNAASTFINHFYFYSVFNLQDRTSQHFSAFLCISLHFSKFPCISLYFSTFLWISLHFPAFLSISLHVYEFVNHSVLKCVLVMLLLMIPHQGRQQGRPEEGESPQQLGQTSQPIHSPPPPWGDQVTSNGSFMEKLKCFFF